MKLIPTKQCEVLKTWPFTVEELKFENRAHPYHRLLCPDWVNILPVSHHGKAILIRQFRIGCLSEILETPGGVIDKSDKSPSIAVERELEEETGFCAERIISLGKLNPNPAIVKNKIYFFLGLGCRPVKNRVRFPDKDEHIELVQVDYPQLMPLVQEGGIDHCLSCLCIFLASNYLNQHNINFESGLNHDHSL